MPPIASELSDEKVMEFFRTLTSGMYTMMITPRINAFAVPEGGTYFALGHHTVVVWKVGAL